MIYLKNKRIFKKIFKIFFLILLTLDLSFKLKPLHAEGSRNIHPAEFNGKRTYLGSHSAGLFGGIINAIPFLYVYAKAGEEILMGSHSLRNGGDIYVYNPQNFGSKGNETRPLNWDFSCKNQGSGLGFIANRAQELAGPNSADGLNVIDNGFAPCHYTAPADGVYGISFTGATFGTLFNEESRNLTIGNETSISAWDVTVRSNKSSTKDLNSRLFTYALPVYSMEFSAKLYLISNDGYKYSLKYNGLIPAGAVFYANSSGFFDVNGEPLYKDIRATNAFITEGPSLAAGITMQGPEYPIFFNDISEGDSNEIKQILNVLSIPHEPLAPSITNPTFSGSLSNNISSTSSGGLINFSAKNLKSYNIVISRDGLDFNPGNPNNRVITGSAANGDHSIIWNGLDNTGLPFNPGSYTIRLFGANGEIHFPMLDVEHNPNGGPTVKRIDENGIGDDTVYYDDRGYRTFSGIEIGEVNGHLCGASSNVQQPTPNHSLVGISSSTPYRSWPAGLNQATECGANAHFGDLKALDLWTYQKTEPVDLQIQIIDPIVEVDVGTAVSVTPSAQLGTLVFGQFSFYNASTNPALEVIYSAAVGDVVTGTCPEALEFTQLPEGVSASYSATSCTISFSNMPPILAGEQRLNFGFKYQVNTNNSGPIPVTTQISSTSETTDSNVAPNQASAQTEIATPIISVIKRANPGANTLVAIGQRIDYTVSVTVANAPLTHAFTFIDSLGEGLAFQAISNFSPDLNCIGPLACSLPQNLAIGTYTVSYSVTVTESAGATVLNQVQITANGGDPSPNCNSCSVEHRVGRPAIALLKTGVVELGANQVLDAGDMLSFRFTVVNTGDVPLTAITLAELSFTGSGIPPEISGGPIDLDVGEKDDVSFTARYMLTQQDITVGSVTNQARATGSSTFGMNDVTDLSDSSSITSDNPTVIPLPRDVQPVPVPIPVNSPWAIGVLMLLVVIYRRHVRVQPHDTSPNHP